MIRISIDVQGFLSMEKDGKMTKQLCPYCSDTNESRCGTWCPHFYREEKVLSLCHGTSYQRTEAI